MIHQEKKNTMYAIPTTWVNLYVLVAHGLKQDGGGVTCRNFETEMRAQLFASHSPTDLVIVSRDLAPSWVTDMNDEPLLIC